MPIAEAWMKSVNADGRVLALFFFFNSLALLPSFAFFLCFTHTLSFSSLIFVCSFRCLWLYIVPRSSLSWSAQWGHSFPHSSLCTEQWDDICCWTTASQQRQQTRLKIGSGLFVCLCSHSAIKTEFGLIVIISSHGHSVYRRVCLHFRFAGVCCLIKPKRIITLSLYRDS